MYSAFSQTENKLCTQAKTALIQSFSGGFSLRAEMQTAIAALERLFFYMLSPDIKKAAGDFRRLFVWL